MYKAFVPYGRDSPNPFADRRILACGLPTDIEILTTEGALPLWSIDAGDRVITRRGAVPVRTLRRAQYLVRVVDLPAEALGRETPESPVTLPAAQPLLLRGTIAQRLCKLDRAVVSAGRLAYLLDLPDPALRNLSIILPGFDSPQVFYAAGLEVGAPDVGALMAIPQDPQEAGQARRAGLRR